MSGELDILVSVKHIHGPDALQPHPFSITYSSAIRAYDGVETVPINVVASGEIPLCEIGDQIRVKGAMGKGTRSADIDILAEEIILVKPGSPPLTPPAVFTFLGMITFIPVEPDGHIRVSVSTGQSYELTFSFSSCYATDPSFQLAHVGAMVWVCGVFSGYRMLQGDVHHSVIIAPDPSRPPIAFPSMTI